MGCPDAWIVVPLLTERGPSVQHRVGDLRRIRKFRIPEPTYRHRPAPSTAGPRTPRSTVQDTSTPNASTPLTSPRICCSSLTSLRDNTTAPVPSTTATSDALCRHPHPPTTGPTAIEPLFTCLPTQSPRTTPPAFP